jgi:KRAB domain-containing zinc finger protein
VELIDGRKSRVTKKKFGCANCDSDFDQFTSLVQHVRRRHLLEDGGDRRSGGGGYCRKCRKRFIRKQAYRRHMEMHKSHSEDISGGGQCQVCRKVFLRSQHLEAHLRTHKGEKPFVCAICSKGFTRKASMEEHVARHKGEKDRECTVSHFTTANKTKAKAANDIPQICHVKFYATSYWRHMSTVHASDEKLVHSCDTCDRKFPHLFRLKIHEKSHLAYNQVETPTHSLRCPRIFLIFLECT